MVLSVSVVGPRDQVAAWELRLADPVASPGKDQTSKWFLLNARCFPAIVRLADQKQNRRNLGPCLSLVLGCPSAWQGC